MRGEILSISVVSRPSGDPYLTISRISIILSKLATTTTTTTDTPWIPPPFQPFAHRKKTRREAQDPHLDQQNSPTPSPKTLGLEIILDLC